MPKGRITVNEERCKGCALCTIACPQGAITLAVGRVNAKGYAPALFNDTEGKCTGCALCAVACPDVCITVYRTVPAAHAAAAG